MTENWVHKTDLIKIESSLWKIRPAEVADAQAIIDYMQDLGDDLINDTGLIADDIETIRKDIIELRQKPMSTIYVALAGKYVVGYIVCRSGSYPINQYSVNLSVTVHPDYRGMGIGTHLMSAVIHWATLQASIHRLELEILVHHTRAIAHCKRLGFKSEGTMIKNYRVLGEKSKSLVATVLMALYL